MKRSDIKIAYDTILPGDDAKERMLASILSAASEASPAGKEIQMKRTNLRKVWLVAAIISLMVFLMGCAVVLFTLQDMQIGEYTYIQSRYIDKNGEKIPAKEVTKDVISLQGIKGSPSQMAAQEWHEFESNYDIDRTLLNEADKNPIKVSREYDAYFVYTQEMVDKVDEIAEKYGLKLAGEIALVQQENPEIFYESLGISGLSKDGAKAEFDFSGGYFYACGNFKAEFEIKLSQRDAIYGSIRYCGKEYLDTVFAYITNIDTYEQWIYKLPDGREALIITGEGHARIFCDTETAFITVSFNAEKLSKQDVELVADSINFSMVPQKPDMEEANRRIEVAYSQWKAEQDAKIEEYEDPFVPKASYAEKIQTIIDNGVDPDKFYYGLYDVNSDGIEDLFLSSETESFGSVYTMYHEETYMLLSFGMDQNSYLCENGVIMHNDPEANPDGYYFYKIGEISGGGMDAKYIDAVVYDIWEESWIHGTDGYYGEEEKITEEEAFEIIESYGRVDLKMKPISEYPMD